ncbi:MAG: acetyltransferase [Gammaproteobacteria bacterium]|nr:acetyltransferase [Gammaproteobacteria bacterium]MDH3370025.1 acetyltransferase [Gammaproteobacteria bacterium]MDH3406646.1 acetyltransferase [Gammaproteobacteria bacterium]MDH3563087.1 acetyltransferase [Gammaproteobacteria bacterium]MDH5487256.1 acetyltransferase [Gammaproteobacteria bacterium]
MNQQKLEQRLAEAVRAACLKAAQNAYENAGISGLCQDGRWECAIAAIRSLDLESVITALPGGYRK